MCLFGQCMVCGQCLVCAFANSFIPLLFAILLFDLTDTSLSSNGMIHILNLLVLDTCKRVFWQTLKIVFIIANSADPDGMLSYVYRSGIFFAILGRGPRAFQIGKISAVNHYFGKFSKQTRTAFLVSLKTKLAITHTIAIRLKENRMQF